MASLGAQVKGEFQRSLEPFFAPVDRNRVYPDVGST